MTRRPPQRHDAEAADPRPPELRRRSLVAGACAAGIGAALSACGGGEDAAESAPLAAPAPERQPLGGIDGGGTGRKAVSFHSVLLTGVQPLAGGDVLFDTRAAAVVDADGAALSVADLARGMNAQVDASKLLSAGGSTTAQAWTIRVGEQLAGPLGQIDSAASSFTLLGQQVVVNAATVFDGVGGLAALSAGQPLRVWGQLDLARSRIVASRVDPGVGEAWTVRGVVGKIDRTRARLELGGVTFQAIGAAVIGDDITSGALVRARLSPASGEVVELRGDALRLPDRDEVKLEGRVTRALSAKRFAIDGVTVDASELGAAVLAQLASLVPGVRVQAAGRSRDGVLRASSVQVENDEGDAIFELAGTISAVDRAAQRFKLRGISVSWSASTRFEGGGAHLLAPRRKVAVKGKLSADRLRLAARRIHVER